MISISPPLALRLVSSETPWWVGSCYVIKRSPLTESGNPAAPRSSADNLNQVLLMHLRTVKGVSKAGSSILLLPVVSGRVWDQVSRVLGLYSRPVGSVKPEHV